MDTRLEIQRYPMRYSDKDILDDLATKYYLSLQISMSKNGPEIEDDGCYKIVYVTIEENGKT